MPNTEIAAIFVLDEDQGEIYINGVEADYSFQINTSSVISFREDPSCSSTIQCNRFGMVKWSSVPTRFFDGEISEFAIWNRALTPCEIVSISMNQSSLNSAVDADSNSLNCLEGCTDEYACNYDADAAIDNGTCELAACTDPNACNFNDAAVCEDGSCDYSCCPGPGCCSQGLFWDWDLSQCFPTNPADINVDGCVQLYDLLDLLSAYGDCSDEESEWQCGEPLGYQGYDYATVQIGEQCWFAENLRAENYNNGEEIPSSLSDGTWSSTTLGATAVYGEGTSDCSASSPDGDACNEGWSLSAYGRYYNWFATIDERGLCPTGWHVPTDSEWTMLTEQLGGLSVAGAKMKTIYGWANGGNGSNSSGLSCLPSGYRDIQGFYGSAGIDGTWWTSTSDGSNAWSRYLNLNVDDVFRSSTQTRYAVSVRCIKNAE